MTTSTGEGQTIGAFVRSEVPEKGDKTVVEHRGRLYDVENLGILQLEPSSDK